MLHRQDTGNRFEFGCVFVFSRPGSRVTQHQCIQRIYAGEENYKAVKHIMGSSRHHINQKNGAQKVCNAKGKLLSVYWRVQCHCHFSFAQLCYSDAATQAFFTFHGFSERVIPIPPSFSWTTSTRISALIPTDYLICRRLCTQISVHTKQVVSRELFKYIKKSRKVTANMIRENNKRCILFNIL